MSINNLKIPTHSQDALIKAAQENKMDTVRRCLRRGDDVNGVNTFLGISDMTALIWACNIGNLDMVRLLIDYGAKDALRLSVFY